MSADPLTLLVNGQFLTRRVRTTMQPSRLPIGDNGGIGHTATVANGDNGGAVHAVAVTKAVQTAEQGTNALFLTGLG
jgi:hypothetical protein